MKDLLTRAGLVVLIAFFVILNVSFIKGVLDASAGSPPVLNPALVGVSEVIFGALATMFAVTVGVKKDNGTYAIFDQEALFYIALVVYMLTEVIVFGIWAMHPNETPETVSGPVVVFVGYIAALGIKLAEARPT